MRTPGSVLYVKQLSAAGRAPGETHDAGTGRNLHRAGRPGLDLSRALRVGAILLSAAVVVSLATALWWPAPGRPGFVVPALEYIVRLVAGALLLLMAIRGRIAAALVSAGGVAGLLLALAWLVPDAGGVMDAVRHSGIEGVAVGILGGITLYAAERTGVITFPWR